MSTCLVTNALQTEDQDGEHQYASDRTQLGTRGIHVTRPRKTPASPSWLFTRATVADDNLAIRLAASAGLASLVRTLSFELRIAARRGLGIDGPTGELPGDGGGGSPGTGA